MNSLKTNNQTIKRTSQVVKTDNQVLRQQRFTLLELLDRLLDKGVMVKGEILLTVADIDLVYLNLGLILSSVKSVEKAYGSGNGHHGFKDDRAGRGGNGVATSLARQTSIQEERVDATHEIEEPDSVEALLDELQPRGVDEPGPRRAHAAISDEPQRSPRREAVSLSAEESIAEAEDTGVSAKPLSAAIDYGLGQLFQPKANIDPENVEKGLARLVLTLVELLRKLMEKQAVRRIDDKQLNAEEVERMGNAFFLLDKKMEQLKKTFDLKDGDLNLDLGPLGDLM